VILLKNIDVKQGLVNGARGVVSSFRRAKSDDFPAHRPKPNKTDLQCATLWPVVRFVNGAEKLLMTEKWQV
jgi:hypothetical protein